ncbi:homoserine dehydrogenase [Thalassobacillus cyri]|uniref:Homoserine dehydrogenase n=1 Tax=Thalassobacillus cyri TaxID=571932 RepID=A0A1H3Y8H4_9BACI|nr:homoserine dehydrogenase [Thalassobacillus cyri]SEA07987.1 homoserine dehydrogenase [Thalassobacillus cyri]
MKKIKAALLGYGTVGQGIHEVLHEHQERLRILLGKEVEIVAILVQNPSKHKNLPENIVVTTNFEEIITLPELDVVFEAIVGEEPALSYLTHALDKGVHVITANKMMFAKHAKSLLEKARENDVKIGFEATTAGGTPVIRTIEQLLQVNRVEKIEAILNGTSNYILTAMSERSIDFKTALAEAKEKGYAEADPTNDIDGTDAFNKLMILSQLIFNDQPAWHKVEKTGIKDLTSTDIQAAQENNKKYKHIAVIYKEGDQLKAEVSPLLLSSSHPLYNIDGVDNAIAITSNIVGTITLIGPGAGKLPTASAMVEDLVAIFQHEPENHSIHQYKDQAAV